MLYLYIASYGTPNSPEAQKIHDAYGDGIYKIGFCPKSYEIEVVDFIEGENISYVESSVDGKYIYGVHELGDGGTVSAFKCEDKLAQVQQMSTGGGGPCHIKATPNHLFVANYGSGSWSAYDLKDGVIGEDFQTIEHEGSGPNEDRQEGPHTHWVLWDAEKNTARVADLGIDHVVNYEKQDDKWVEVSRFDLAPGDGPRSIALNRNGMVFVTNELGNSVSVFDPETHEEIQKIDTLPKDFSEENTVSELQFSPDEKFLFVGNRGHDSIVVFKHDPRTNELSVHDWLMTGGETPRAFAVCPEGKWLFIANQDGSNIRVYENIGDKFVEKVTHAFPKPYCIRHFADVDQ